MFSVKKDMRNEITFYGGKKSAFKKIILMVVLYIRRGKKYIAY